VWQETGEKWLAILVTALVAAAGLLAVTALLLFRQLAVASAQQERLDRLTAEWQMAQQTLQELLRQRDQLGLLVRLMQRFVSASERRELLTTLLSELGLFFKLETAEGVLLNQTALYGIWRRQDGRVYLQEWDSDSARQHLHWMGAQPMAGEASGDIVVPVRAEGTVIAVLHLVRLAPFTPEDRQFLEIVAAQVALALGRIKLITSLETLSITDALTGIANRRHWDLRLAEEVARAQRYRYPLAVLMVDIDHFKQINDRYGHQIGDFVLQQVVQRLRQNLRRTDFVARYGGEEFGVLAPQTSLESARILSERLRRAIHSEPITVTGTNGPVAIPVTISVGVAVFPDHAQNESDLVAAADAALYQAKQAGRNCVRMADTAPKGGE
jgi:diguanylate cyclase (GGDEF)-like protein